GAAAIVVGDGPVLAEYLGGAGATEEFVDQWRTPGDMRTRHWEERFGETKYVPLGEQAWREGLKRVGLSAEQVDVVVATGSHARSVKGTVKRLGVAKEAVADD